MRRAKSSAAYVKRHITNPKRLTYIGMGESNILNGCECESPIQSNCSEEEHQKNRRTEMIVISTDGVKADLKKKINTLK
jgi:outer membrane protein OmpA-like peptidoglycan-associated protein